MTDHKLCTDGKPHEPNPDTVSQANDCDWILDVACKRCGRTGSLAIDPTEFDYD